MIPASKGYPQGSKKGYQKSWPDANVGRFGGSLREREDPMQLNDDDIWAIAIGMDFSGIERNFLIYANRRGFTIRSRTKGAHSTLKELNENNVREQIAFIYRINIDKFQHRPRPVHSTGSNNGPTETERFGTDFRVIDRLRALESELSKFQGQ